MIDTFHFGVQIGRQYATKHSDKHGRPGISENIRTRSISDSSLCYIKVTEKHEKMMSWTAILPRSQIEVENEEAALADSANMMLSGATCLKSTTKFVESACA